MKRYLLIGSMCGLLALGCATGGGLTPQGAAVATGASEEGWRYILDGWEW